MTYQSPFEQLKAELGNLKNNGCDISTEATKFVEDYEQAIASDVEEFNAFLERKRAARAASKSTDEESRISRALDKLRNEDW